MGTIEPRLRSGVFVLFHEYVDKFARDYRFACDAEEAAGLLVEACLSLVGTVYEPRAGALIAPPRRGGSAGVGTLVRRRGCGRRDTMDQAGEGVEGEINEGGA